MASSPRCPECGGPATYEAPEGPCERCVKAWAWLDRWVPEDLRNGWREARDELYRTYGGEAEPTLEYVRIVSWQNRVVTLAGFKNQRRWAERRFAFLIKAVVNTEKAPVFVTPRVGASIARKLEIDRRKESP